MPRAAGSKNRNYPSLALSEALRVPTAIQDQASGMAVSRLTLAELLGVSPQSSLLRELVASSRMYGLTNGGINADEFSLTPLGEAVTGADEMQQAGARKTAVMRIPPYSAFFEAFSNKKVPSATVFREFLTKNADVPTERAEECMGRILEDGQSAGLFRPMKGGDYVDLTASTPFKEEDPQLEDEEGESPDPGSDEEEADESPEAGSIRKQTPASSGPPKKVFVAHGKNRAPLEQLKDALGALKVAYAVAVDEPNAGRPISRKVAALMRDDCSSGIFIFTADERFVRESEDGTSEEVWRPSENVIYELGAASILYENRIVIFKEKGVAFPSDFRDLGYIEFEKDQLVAEFGSLVKELVGLDILEVRAKG